MTGGKKLAQVRAELEAALGPGPNGEGVVAESLRRFLASGKSPANPPQARSPRSNRPKLPRRGGTAKRDG